MRTFTAKPKGTWHRTSAESTTLLRAQIPEVESVLYLQRTIGNRAADRLLHKPPKTLGDKSRDRTVPWFAATASRATVNTPVHTRIQQGLSCGRLEVPPGGVACATVPGRRATSLEPERKAGVDRFAGEPIAIQPEGPDQTPAPLNDDGLIDGEWSSELVARTFVNGGKTGTATVNWVGGVGGTTPGVGAITTVAPVIEKAAPAAAGGTAQAWVRAGTGKATVRRSYTGVLVGANGASYYITARAAARIDRHEENHIAHSRTHHNTFVTPVEARVARHTGQAKALSHGATDAAAKTALETFLDWNSSITSFRNADTADNTPGGTVDTADAASAGFYRDYGARAVGGVNYAHYIDTPPGP